MKTLTKKAIKPIWFVYIVQCRDQSLYTGITNNLERRINQHNDDSSKSKAAKYTRARQPVNLVYQEPCIDRSAASKREHAIKQLKRQEKLALIQSL